MINNKIISKIIETSLGIKKGKLKYTDNSDTISSWDSLGIINIITALENELECKFDIDDYERFNSVKEINNIIIEKKIKI